LKERKSEYRIAIFGAIISITLTAIYDFIKDKPILSTLLQFLKWIWNNIFEFSFSVWQILAVLLVIYLVNKIRPKKKRESPKFLSYVSDEFDNKTWKWNWKWNPSTQKYNVINLIPLCNKCGTATILNSEYIDKYATCPRCDNFMNKLKAPDNIEAIIIDNIDRNLHLEKIK
jgi:hypothetical protein